MPKDFSFSSEDLDPIEAERIYEEEVGELTPREDMIDNGVIDNQVKSKEVLMQEMISHKQQYQETFSPKEAEEYFTKLHYIRDQYRYAK